MSLATEPDRTKDGLGDRAALNQSLEIAPAGAAAQAGQDPPLSDPVPAQGGAAGPVGETGTEPNAVQTLKARTTGTSVLGRLSEDATPWWRSGIGALTIVLAVIVCVFFVLRRFVPAIRAADGDVLRVVARASLTPKQTLSLIQLHRRFVLVAVSAGRVDPLCEVSDADEVAELMVATGAKSSAGDAVFDAHLRAEAAGYNLSSVEDVEKASDTTGGRRGGAMAELLYRLRALRQTG